MRNLHVVGSDHLGGVQDLSADVPLDVRFGRQQRCVLIVHSDEATHILFSLFFQRLHHVENVVLHHATSQHEALLMVKQKPFDLILLSTEARRLSLEAMVQRMRAASQHPTVALIGMRFPDLDGGRERHLRAGFTDFLAAPPMLDDFMRVVGSRLTSLQKSA